MSDGRSATLERKTKETDIRLSLGLDGTGQYDVETGIPFFDHMLESFAKHGLFDLHLRAKGDIEVDLHHTVEDVGIVLGQAIRQALGEARGIRRYGNQVLPMAESKVEVSVDVSNRAFLVYKVGLSNERIGQFDASLAEGFPVRARPERRARSARRAPLRQEPPPRSRGDLQGASPGAARGAGAGSPPRRCPLGEGRLVAMTRAAPRVAVVDYGAGNLRSVSKALERSGLRAEVCGDPAGLAAADAVVLPGVGAFADAMTSLRDKGLDDAVRTSIASGRPYLGLCLGLQLLFEESDEHGAAQGSGPDAGRVQRFPETCVDGGPLRVPHIGWNEVRFAGDHPMIAALPETDVFYFVHSFHAVPTDSSDEVGVNRVWWTQLRGSGSTWLRLCRAFHPEKSQASGGRLLDAFASWIQEC